MESITSNYSPKNQIWNISHILHSEFKRRKQTNRKYSLRAFAHNLGISSGALSEILQQKRVPSYKLQTKLSERLALSQIEIQSMRSETKVENPSPQKKISLTEFSFVSTWYHYALLALFETKGFRSEPAWIAKRLGISPSVVRAALNDLKRSGMLVKVNGQWSLNSKNTMTGDMTVTALSIRSFHAQALQLSMKSLECVPREERDITSLTLAFDTSKLELAKDLIRKFKRDMASLVETKQAREVYQLNVQLIPLTTKDSV